MEQLPRGFDVCHHLASTHKGKIKHTPLDRQFPRRSTSSIHGVVIPTFSRREKALFYSMDAQQSYFLP
jgi:hypothetical protein